MKKKFFLLLLIVFISVVIFPIPTYAAADYNITANGIYDFTSFEDDQKIIIAPNLTVTISNIYVSTLKNSQIQCGDGVTLTVHNIIIENKDANACPLWYKGSGSLILSGTSKLTGGAYSPGIRIEDSNSLVISGSGAIDVTGGLSAAGIGAAYNTNTWGNKCGKINIKSGKVTATGGIGGSGLGGGAGIGGALYGESSDEIKIEGGIVIAKGGDYSAGIGSGDHPDQSYGGKTTITGGNVTATGGFFGAGIGGGHESNCGDLTIEGGTVKATGGENASGIGGGSFYYEGPMAGKGALKIKGGSVEAKGGSGGAGIGTGKRGKDMGPITIEGGTVKVTGGDYAAGIGGGYAGAGGTINIKGGRTETEKGLSGTKDIGDARYATRLSISGDAVVFIKSNSIVTPSTSHTHYTISDTSGGEKIGISYPSGWAAVFGVYLKPCTLSYNANGGTGALPSSVTKHKGLTATVADGSHITRDKYTNGGWNSLRDGNGTSYSVGTVVTLESNLPLYIKWNEIRVTSVSLSSNSETMIDTDTLTLTATVLPNDATHPEVTWSSDDDTVATVDQNGLVTAVGVGNATITGESDGQSDTCSVTVEAKRVTSVSVDKKTLSIRKGSSKTLVATVTPSDATYSDVTWTSSDTGIAKVDQNGVVRGVKKGKATITAEADGKSDTSAVSVYLLVAPKPEKPEDPEPDPTQSPGSGKTDGSPDGGGADGDTETVIVEVEDAEEAEEVIAEIIEAQNKNSDNGRSKIWIWYVVAAGTIVVAAGTTIVIIKIKQKGTKQRKFKSVS